MSGRSVVMAAGASTRMKSPLSKLLHPLLGKEIICRAYEQAQFFSHSPPYFIVGHQREEILQKLDGKFGKDAYIPVVQDPPQGTGDAVKKAIEALSKDTKDDEAIFIMGGDAVLLSRQSLEAFRDQHLRKKAVLSLLSMELPDPGAYGRVVRNSQGQPQKIVEFKNASEEEKQIREVNAGFYIVQFGALKEALSQLKEDELTKEFYLTDLVEYFVGQNRFVLAHSIANFEECLGINTQKERALAEEVLRMRKLEEVLASGVQISQPDSVWIEEDVQIEAGAQIGRFVSLKGKTKIGRSHIQSFCVIEDSEIADDVRIREFSHLEKVYCGKGAEIGPFARLRPGTVLDEKAKVGNFVELKKTHLKAGAKANHLSYVGDAVVEEKANIGAGTITCNYDGYDKFKTEIGKSAFIGSNSSLVAPVKIGDGAIVGAGSVITEDVAADAIAIERSNQSVREGAAKRFRDKKGK